MNDWMVGGQRRAPAYSRGQNAGVGKITKGCQILVENGDASMDLKSLPQIV